MSLSVLARKILRDPMHFLHIERVKADGTELQDAIAHPDHIYNYANFSQDEVGSKKKYGNALREIRSLSRKRGQHPGKFLIHESIKKYAKTICHKFTSLNRMNTQIKTVYGSELPVRYRQMFQAYFRNPEGHIFNMGSTENPPVESQPLEDKEVSLDLEGLSFTLSKGASLTIGKLTTKTLDFKGLKSVSIEKVEDGCLYGVSLET